MKQSFVCDQQKIKSISSDIERIFSNLMFENIFLISSEKPPPPPLGNVCCAVF